MVDFLLGSLLGFGLAAFIFEPFILNFIYFTNLDLFNDIVLTKKNRIKLKEYYSKK